MKREKAEGPRSDLRCPGGHSIPHSTKFGRCTPMYCSLENQEPQFESQGETLVADRKKRELKRLELVLKTEHRDEKVEKRVMDSLVDPQSKDSGDVITRESSRLEKGAIAERHGARFRDYAIRIAKSRMPLGLEGADAEEWADKEMVRLLPDAVTQVGWGLRFGTPDERMAAARVVLDATGRSKRETAAGQQPLVIMVNGGGTFVPPWSQKTKVVEAKQVQSLPEGTSERRAEAAEEGEPRTVEGVLSGSEPQQPA